MKKFILLAALILYGALYGSTAEAGQTGDCFCSDLLINEEGRYAIINYNGLNSIRGIWLPNPGQGAYPFGEKIYIRPEQEIHPAITKIEERIVGNWCKTGAIYVNAPDVAAGKCSGDGGRPDYYTQCSTNYLIGSSQCVCKWVGEKCEYKEKADYCCCKQTTDSAGVQKITSCKQISSYKSLTPCNENILISGEFDYQSAVSNLAKKGQCLCPTPAKRVPEKEVADPQTQVWYYFSGPKKGQLCDRQCWTNDEPNKNPSGFFMGGECKDDKVFEYCELRSVQVRSGSYLGGKAGGEAKYESVGQCFCHLRGEAKMTASKAVGDQETCSQYQDQGCEWRSAIDLSNPVGYLTRGLDSNGGCSAFLQEMAGAAGQVAEFKIEVKDLQNKAKFLNQLSFKNPAEFVGQLVKVLLAFIGSIALILYIYAGIMWMRSSGNSEEIGKAQQILVWTTLGVAVMLGSYLLVNFIFGNILKLLYLKE